MMSWYLLTETCKQPLAGGFFSLCITQNKAAVLRLHCCTSDGVHVTICLHTAQAPDQDKHFLNTYWGDWKKLWLVFWTTRGQHRPAEALEQMWSRLSTDVVHSSRGQTGSSSPSCDGVLALWRWPGSNLWVGAVFYRTGPEIQRLVNMSQTSQLS